MWAGRFVSFSISKQETCDKMWVGSGFEKKKGRIAGLRRKYRQEGGDLRTPIVDPLLCFHIRKFFFWINNICL